MNKTITLLLLVSTMLFWAANFHVVKIALNSYSPLGVAAWRFFFGIISLFIVLYFQFGNSLFKFKFSVKEWWYMFLTSFFGIFLTIYFFNLGLKTTSAVNGSLIIAASPAITAIFTFLFQKKEVTFIQWLAIGISFFGVALILVKGDFSKLAQLQFEIGDVYILVMAIVFSLSQIIVSKYLPHIDATIMTTVTSLIAFILFTIFSLPELLSTPIPYDLYFWGSILFMGILGTGIAYTAFYFCVVKLGATTSTLYMNLIPFFAALLAFPFGEVIHTIQVLGGILIILGLLLFEFSKKNTP